MTYKEAFELAESAIRNRSGRAWYPDHAARWAALSAVANHGSNQIEALIASLQSSERSWDSLSDPCDEMFPT
jgi:hypothetical protein